MYVSLRIWNLDTGFGKLIKDDKIQVAANPAPWCPAHIDPDEQFEIDGVVSVFHKAYRRLMGLVHQGFVFCGRHQDFLDLAWIGIV